MDVLVVESPAKAKTIGKYLGPGFTVLASYGHVRDLPPKDGSVRPDVQANDLLRMMIAIFHIPHEDGWAEQARRILNLVIDGLEPR